MDRTGAKQQRLESSKKTVGRGSAAARRGSRPKWESSGPVPSAWSPSQRGLTLATLRGLREEARELGEQAFKRLYWGYFLVPLGPTRTAHADGDLQRTLDLGAGCAEDETLRCGFDSIYKPEALHPLSGWVFCVRRDVPTQLLIGRNEYCSIVVPDPSVSDLHCVFRCARRSVSIEDVVSTNGTLLNMSPIEPGQLVPVGDRDVITLGRFSLSLVSVTTMWSQLQQL